MAPSGSYAIGWDQVTLDGVRGADMERCRAGAAWRWSGGAVRLDGPPGVLRLPEGAETVELRRRVRRGAARLVVVPPVAEGEAARSPGPAITVTDGWRAWRVDLVPARPGGRALAHFPDGPPPVGTDLWIVQAERMDEAGSASGTVPLWEGIAAGTPVDTPEGAVAADRLCPGMAVLTAAGGVAEVMRAETRTISGARLCACPGMAPVRIAAGALGGGVPRADLWLAPDQGVLVEAARAGALWPAGPVAATARDLAETAVGGAAARGSRQPGIARAMGVPGMTAVVLTLAGGAASRAAGAALVGSWAAEGAPRRLTRGELAILHGPCIREGSW